MWIYLIVIDKKINSSSIYSLSLKIVYNIIYNIKYCIKNIIERMLHNM